MSLPDMKPIVRFRPLAVAAAVTMAACSRAGVAPTAQRATAPGAAPDTDTAAVSRAEAYVIIARGLRALGVADTGSVPGTFEVVLESRQARANWLQARRWTDSVPGTTPARLSFLVDVNRPRVLQELHSPAPGDIWFKTRTRYDTAGAWQVDLLGWRTGTDVLRGTAVASRAAMSPLERLMPHTALLQAARSADALRAGPGAHSVRYADASTRQPVTIEFDSVSHLPVAISSPATNRTEFHGYRDVAGVRVPFRRVQRSNGQVTGVQEVVSVDLRPSVAEVRYQVPAGYADPPVAGPPRATQVAEGLYRLDDMPGGYHAAFIVGDSTVAVLEAPLGPQFTAAAIQLIRSVAPGKRIARVYVTHHHADHVGGLGPYVALGARVVVGNGLEEAIRRQLPDSLKAAVRFEVVSGTGVFDDGVARVQAFEVPNTHADGNVAYYLPSSRVLFQGDLFYIPERGDVPPAFPVTQALRDAVRAHALAVNLVVGVHGRSGTWEEVMQSLSRGRLR